MLKSSHLRVFSVSHLIYCFRENLFTSRLTLSENTSVFEAESPVNCWWGKIFYAVKFFTKTEKQLDLQVNKTLSSCQNLEHGIAGFSVIRKSKS